MSTSEKEVIIVKKLLKDMTMEEVNKSSKEHNTNHEALHCIKCGEVIVLKRREVREVNYCIKADGTRGEELSSALEMQQRLYLECGCRCVDRSWRYEDGTGRYDVDKTQKTKLEVGQEGKLEDLTFVKETVYF